MLSYQPILFKSCTECVCINLLLTLLLLLVNKALCCVLLFTLCIGIGAAVVRMLKRQTVLTTTCLLKRCNIRRGLHSTTMT